MSLIDEALKRAGLEARTDQRLVVAPSPWPNAQVGAARRSRKALWTGLLAGLASGLLVAVVFLALPPRPRTAIPNPQPAADRVAAVSPPERASESAAPAPVVEHRPVRTWPEGAAEAPAAPEGLTARQSRLPTPSGPAAEASGEAKTRPAPIMPVVIPPPAAASPAPPAAAAPVDGKEYSHSLDLPDGARIALSGIAYSETRPVAVLNGRVMGPGEMVGGYTIARILPDRVEFNGRGVTFAVLLN
jgi:hypothetical protein